ncbi:MAG: choice-of-anchor tandem repeat GloVer-containing protein [Candidatus Korobacteraceae bacterium]
MRENIGKCTISNVGVAVVLTFVLAIIAGPAAQAQTFNVIYSYAGSGTSAHAIGGVTVDRRGNLYGTTAWGGSGTPGTVYEMRHTGSGFVYSELHAFGGGANGDFPWDAPTIGPNGSLYATMNVGGADGEGTVVNLQPPSVACRSVSCPWNETDLYNFTRQSDGGNPQSGIIFDAHGNIYGTNVNGGSGYGVVYEMTPSGDGWTYQVLYTFTGGRDGANPASLLLFDSAGNLYGTAMSGGLPGCTGFGCGTVYKLSPSGSGWTETTLYSFTNGADGAEPSAGLVADSAGNLYGATPGSDGNGGTVFELSPSGENWVFNLIYDLSGPGPGPSQNLVRDAAGNLYGVTWGDGAYNQGNVFKLAPTSNGWTYTSLHDFSNGSDGSNALGGLTMDSSGVLYGTTYDGGSAECACGVVFEITP